MTSKERIIDCLDRIDKESDDILKRGDLLLGVSNWEAPNLIRHIGALIIDDLKDLRRALEELRELTR